MAMSKKNLLDWLSTLPEDDEIYIDEGGSTLKSTKYPHAYYEVGGGPRDKDDEIIWISVYAQNTKQAGKVCWKEELVDSDSMDIHILKGTREELLSMAVGFENRPNNADGLYWRKVAKTVREELK